MMKFTVEVYIRAIYDDPPENTTEALRRSELSCILKNQMLSVAGLLDSFIKLGILGQSYNMKEEEVKHHGS